MIALSSGFLRIFNKVKPLLVVGTDSRFSSNVISKDTALSSSSLPKKFAALLENSPDIKSLKKLHACIFTHGHWRSVFLGSKLLKSYARFNLVAESRWVFREIINGDISLWNSVIVGYFRAKVYDEVLRLYIELRHRKIGLQVSAIAFCLKSCAETGDVEFGRNVHVDAIKFGLNGDQVVGSSLIKFYSKFGRIEEAGKVFDEIIERDVVVYTSLITAYAQVCDHRAREAFRIAHSMQRNGNEPNRVTLISLLQASSALGALREGKSIHGFSIRRGIGCSDEVFETSLTGMYMKGGNTSKAAAIFGKMNERTLGSWNALIAGHLQLGRPSQALQIFSQMVQENLEVDLITLANVLLTCADLGYLCIGKSIHCYILRSGVQLDVVATTALVDMYSMCKHLKEAREVFQGTHDKDVILFNVMIAGYLHNGSAYLAIQTCYEMIRARFRPNSSTILSVLSALTVLQDIQRGKCIHGYVFRQGFELNTETANQLVDMYAKCGIVQQARQVFDGINNKDIVSWTSMMRGYVIHDMGEKTMTLFRLMQRECHHCDPVALTILLQALNQLDCESLAREVHGRMYRLFLDKDIPLINSLITSYSKCGKLNVARDLFEHMPERHLSSWNTIIAACGTHGDCIQALELFYQMKNENASPDNVTFTSILSACSHSGFLEDGLRIFKSMKEEYGVVPSDEHCGCVIDLLSRAGRLEDSYNLLKSVPALQNISTLGTLLAACRVHGNTEIGEIIGKWLLDMDPQNPSSYCSMMNLYASEQKWDQVAHIGAIAKERGLRRTSGYSLLQF